MKTKSGLLTAGALSAALAISGCATPGGYYSEDNNGNARVTPAQNVPMTCGGTIIDRGARTGNTVTYDPARSTAVRKCDFGNAARANESTGIIGQEIERAQRGITRDVGNEVRRGVRDALRGVLNFN